MNPRRLADLIGFLSYSYAVSRRLPVREAWRDAALLDAQRGRRPHGPDHFDGPGYGNGNGRGNGHRPPAAPEREDERVGAPLR